MICCLCHRGTENEKRCNETFHRVRAFGIFCSERKSEEEQLNLVQVECGSEEGKNVR
jgi:hypothetical protein